MAVGRGEPLFAGDGPDDLHHVEISVRIDGDRMTRRPSDQVKAHGFEIKEQERFRFGGIVERLLAVKPA